MYRLPVFLILLVSFISCSKNDGGGPIPPVVIPDVIDGGITEFTLTPLDINTPDKGTFFISANNTIYKVDFNAVAEAAANATISFETETILNDQSRQYANLGNDAIAYNPVAQNQVLILFKDGRKVIGAFNLYTSFGGVFGQALIAQWRDVNDPAKPNQKAKNDIINLVHRYADKDGPGTGTTPSYLLVTITKS